MDSICECGSVMDSTPSRGLTPDLRLASVGYAMTAATVPDGSITAAKLAGNISVSKISGLPDLQTNLVQLTQAYSNYTALLTRLNAPPVANAGGDQYSLFGSTISLDGSRSADPNGNPLTFRWTLSSVPEGSAVTLDSLANCR